MLPSPRRPFALLFVPAWSAAWLAACSGPVVSATADDASSTGTTGAVSEPELTTDLTPTTSAGTTTTAGDTTGEPPGGLAEGPLQAGVAVGYLTGPVGASMAGYGGRTEYNETPWNDVLNGSSGFYGLGAAKAIALEVEGERLVLLKLPTMSSEASITEGTLTKLKELHDLDLGGRLITAATHSHHNIARYWRLPVALAAVGADSPDEEIIDRISTQLAQVVADAVADLGPAEWGTAAADDWDPDNFVYRDRRGENDPTYGKDPRLTLLAVRRPGGAPMATIFNFGMHGTVFDSDNELFTEDAAGGVELKFEEHFFARTGAPIFGMFMQSGGGDASPGGDRFGHPGAARVELIGEDAAPRIYDVYETIAWKTELRLGVRSRRIDLTYAGIGYDEIPEFKNAADYPYTWGGWQCTSPVEPDDANPATSSEGMPKKCTDIKTLLETLGEPVPHGEIHQMYTTVASLDDFFLVTLPGEPTYSVVKHVREELGTRDVGGMVVGYSQDHMLYLAHPDDWYQGGYEAEMSLWGPLAAKHIVARQMELVEALKAGEGTPVWSEESANLSLAKPFEPRAVERSEDAGSTLADVASDIQRGDTVRLAWGGGDPSLGEPRVVLQVESTPGEFTDVPAPSGWPGAALDNSRYHMLTHYNPDPAPNGQILPTRKHHWFVDFQAPLDLPAGNYRLVASGPAMQDALTQYEVPSSPFLVGAGKADTLTATLKDGTLTLAWTHEQPQQVLLETYPTDAYRLLDPTVPPDQPATIRATLTLDFFIAGEPAGDTFEVPFTPGKGHILDFARTGLAPDNLSVRAHLANDIVPSFVEAEVISG